MSWLSRWWPYLIQSQYRFVSSHGTRLSILKNRISTTAPADQRAPRPPEIVRVVQCSLSRRRYFFNKSAQVSRSCSWCLLLEVLPIASAVPSDILRTAAANPSVTTTSAAASQMSLSFRMFPLRSLSCRLLSRVRKLLCEFVPFSFFASSII